MFLNRNSGSLTKKGSNVPHPPINDPDKQNPKYVTYSATAIKACPNTGMNTFHKT